MKIGFDARILSSPKCGISTYLYNLVKNLLQLRKDLEIFLFSDKEFRSEHKKILNFPQVKKIIFASSKKEKKKWAQKFLPKKLKEYKIDIYHAVWNNAVPFFRNCPCVLTIHDLAPWILGDHFKNKWKEIKYKLQHFFCAHWADVVITDSYNSKKDIVKLCRLKEDKVKVVYLGLDEDFEKEELDKDLEKQILKIYNLEKRCYLIDPAGIDHPRRNPRLVVEGFYRLLKRKNYDFYLLFTGNFYKENKVYKYLVKRIKDLGIEKRIIITGWVPTKHLKVLLSNALISIIPSLYEGFGLPILESFFCEVPVITTNRGSIPEIADDAAILIDPYDYESLSKEIEKLIEDNGLREELIKKGKKRLVNFDWRKTAFQILGIYDNLLKDVKRSRS